MARTSSILFLLASTISLISASPIIPRQEPATVQFTPFAGPCEMSTDPFSTEKPVSYNLTSGATCYTPPYAFISYVEDANSLALSGSCALGIFTGPGCTGTSSPATLTSSTECVFQSGQSFEFDCGP